MKARILTDDPSLIVMFRLGSIEGIQTSNYDEAKDKFYDSIKEDDLAVLILTKTVEGWLTKEVKEYRESESIPLIVVIDG
ncbi:V-type ATP synthase subunit F [Anaerococcus provencensis]|uniref:V-type ATP synthase subunit F n=1 Tax=Anaerococcus provencensis TaxID=938293 RepID=UPI00030FD988|nr:V-type ATP synthase subunit F [Anaerococcus provencensis]